MADADNKVDETLKGGHPPAQKVAGVRIVQKATPEKATPPPPAKPTDEEKEEFGEDEKPAKQSTAVVSGAKTGEMDAFPKEAVKVYHEKPMPKLDNRPVQKPVVIQQPRK